MPDHLLIYVIVLLNALTQAMLIWRFKLEPAKKWKLCCSTVAVPLLLAITMRLLIAQGIIPAKITDQSFIEQLITKGSSMLLIAGPWMVTIAVTIIRLKERAALKKSVSM
jgi:hypothetical protein